LQEPFQVSGNAENLAAVAFYKQHMDDLSQGLLSLDHLKLLFLFNILFNSYQVNYIPQ
jgi:hypothetical protein